MEINVNSRLRRTEALVRPDGSKKSAAGDPAVSEPQPQTDRVTLDRQSIEHLEEQSRRIRELLEQSQQQVPVKEKKPAIWDILDGEESGDSEAEAMGENLKTMERCQKIAARIMRGDKVPPQDEQYLRENDPDGYKLALAMRTPKKNPKKWESVLKEEEKTSESGGGEDAAEVPSSGEPGGTSDAGGDSAASGE